MEGKNNSMELDEDHFSRDEARDEAAFKNDFETPSAFNQMPSIGDGDGDDGADGGADDGAGDAGDAADKADAFQFDDALAQEEADELKEMNEKLGTNFESRNELDAALKQTENKEVKVEMAEEKRYINYFKDLLDDRKYPDEVLVKEDKMIAAINAEKDIKDPMVIEEIESEMAILLEGGMISYAAKSIRDNLRMSLKEKEKLVGDFDSSQKETAQQAKDKYKQELQEGVNAIFKQGKFMGIQPTKDDMLDIYKDISKNKHIEHLKAHPKDAVEFALFKKYRETIMKNSGKPNYEAGVKNTLNELGMSNSQQTGTDGKDIAKASASDELSFLQKFAQ